MSKRKTARSKPPLKLPLEIHGDRSGTYGLVVVAPLWEVPRCMPLRGKIGILPSSSSSHLVKLEDLIFFFPLGLPTASWVSRCTKLRYKISICIIYILHHLTVALIFLRCTLFLKGTYTINMNIRYARRHFHPFIRMGIGRAKPQNKEPLRGCCCRCPAPKGWSLTNIGPIWDLNWICTAEVLTYLLTWLKDKAFPIGLKATFQGQTVNC